MIRGGETDADAVVEQVRQQIAQTPQFRIDYVDLLSFPQLNQLETIEGTVLLAVAAWLGQTRLIDNVIIDTLRLNRKPLNKYQRDGDR